MDEDYSGEASKYFVCRQCGFICNIERDSIGDGVGSVVPWSTLATDLVGNETSIELASTNNFPLPSSDPDFPNISSGGVAFIYSDNKVRDMFEYTGKTSTHLTGVTGLSTSHSSGDVVSCAESIVQGGCPFCGSYLYI